MQVLDDHMGLLSVPQEPEGPEWPYRRAFLDGRLHEATMLKKRILSLAYTSTDGSENTEDTDE